MRRILTCLLLALLVVPTWVGAKVVDEENKLFSVEAPDAWTYSSTDKAWSNQANNGALVLSSVEVKISLDEWAKNAAGQNAGATIHEDSLGGIPARRLEFLTEGYQTYLWIAIQGKQGAIVTLVHNQDCPDDIPAIKRNLMSSFQWK